MTAQGTEHGASHLRPLSPQAGTSTRAKAGPAVLMNSTHSWDRLARNIPHVAKWNHLASSLQRSKALGLEPQPPRLPLAEDTSACVKAEGSRRYRTGGMSLLPHPLPSGQHTNAKRETMQFSTQDFIGGTLQHRSEEPRWHVCGGRTMNPGPTLLFAQASRLEAQPEHAATDPVVVWELLNGACGDRVGCQGGVPGWYRDTWPCATPNLELPRAAQNRL